MLNTLNPNPAERRRHVRRKYRTSAHLCLANSQEYFHATTLEIGAGGMSLYIEANLPTATHCIIDLNLPLFHGGWIKLELEAIVVRCIFSHQSAFKIALQFCNLPSEIQSEIQKFVDMQ